MIEIVPVRSTMWAGIEKMQFMLCVVLACGTHNMCEAYVGVVACDLVVRDIRFNMYSTYNLT